MCRCHRSKAIFIVASCMLWLVLFISYDCSVLICTIPYRGSLSLCARDIYIPFLFPLCLNRVSLEMGVEGKGWGTHCQLAEHETFYVSWSKNSESVLTPLQNCQSSSDSRPSWNYLEADRFITTLPQCVLTSFHTYWSLCLETFPWDAHGAASLSSFRFLFTWHLLRDDFIGHPFQETLWSFSHPLPSILFLYSTAQHLLSHTFIYLLVYGPSTSSRTQAS